MKRPAVYLLASAPFGTLYVGVTSDLNFRMAQHAQGLFEGFTKKHGIKVLVYYEFHLTMADAIAREKRLKKWNRQWKYRLVEETNPEWRNLFDPTTGEVFDPPALLDRLQSEPDPFGDLPRPPPTRG